MNPLLRKLAFFLLLPVFCKAQVADNSKKLDLTIKVNGNAPEYTTISQSSNDTSVLSAIYKLYFKDLIDKKDSIAKLPDSDARTSLTDLNKMNVFVDPNNLADDAGIILVRYATKKADNTKANKHVLNTLVVSKAAGKYGSYLYNKRRLLLVFLDETINADSIDVKNQPSFFLKSFQSAVSLLLKPADESILKKTRLVFMDKKAVHPPSEISYVVPIGDDKGSVPDPDYGATKKEKITNHEKNHFAFTVGLNASFLQTHNLAFKGDTVSVTLDSAQKKSLKSAISMALEWYPWGRDIDNLSPVWQHFGPLTQRIGLTVGVSLTNDPLQSFYLGGVFSISKYCSFVAGSYLVNDIKNGQTLGISTITSASSLKDYLHRSYKGSFYLGISISPAEAIKDLFSSSK